jgi:hypothetical protein
MRIGLCAVEDLAIATVTRTYVQSRIFGLGSMCRVRSSVDAAVIHAKLDEQLRADSFARDDR